MEKSYINKFIRLILGFIVLGMGVGLMLFTNRGVDPASVLSTGVAKQFNTSFGMGNGLVNIVILAVIFFVDKSYINIASILSMFIMGPFVDITMKGLNSLAFMKVLVSNFYISLLLVVLASFIMSVGLNLYSSAKLGFGAIDILSEILTDRIGVNYKYIRTAMDVLVVIIGYLLGGSFGLGTIIVSLTFGFMVSLTRDYIEK